MSASQPSIILSSDEIRAITGASAPTVQFNELRRLGFTRVRRGLDRSIILERAHYEAVCAGAIVLPPGKVPKAVDALSHATRLVAAARTTVASSAAPATPTPPAPSPPPAPQPPSDLTGRRAGSAKITLEEWARQTYSTPISHWVLMKWRREGEIYPPPERVARVWFVQSNARRLIDGVPYDYVPLVERLKR